MSTPKSKIVIGPEHVVTMIDTINHLFNETGRLFNQYQNEPTSGSIAAREMASFASPEVVRDVHYRGVLSMEAAADHLVSFADLLMQPAKTVAPWTCVRGLLESAAIGIWLQRHRLNRETRHQALSHIAEELLNRTRWSLCAQKCLSESVKIRRVLCCQNTAELKEITPEGEALTVFKVGLTYEGFITLLRHPCPRNHKGISRYFLHFAELFHKIERLESARC